MSPRHPEDHSRGRARGGRRRRDAIASQPLFDSYRPLPGTYDEMFGDEGTPRAAVCTVTGMLEALGRERFRDRKRLADAAFLRGGVTFTVYSDERGSERVFPFDPIPRLVAASEWEQVELGLRQRLRALNALLSDLYGRRRILAEGRIPAEVVETSKGYLRTLCGIRPPGGVFVHVGGIDLIREPSGRFLVLEDNLRCPSGVSYVLENRAVMKRVLPRIFGEADVRSVDGYPLRLREALAQSAPEGASEPRIVVLTPGPFNSAYFEHCFLARRMGCDLVVPSDLFVKDDRVYVKTTAGPQRVDVLYRRIDDEFIDPEVFRADSMLGIRGLVRAYRAGHVTLANALGNGVADDKAMYPFVPEIIRFYLDEEPLIGQVETLSCAREEDRKRVLADLSRFVVKSVDASGGYGMVIGPSATREQLRTLATQIRANPRGYIAQPRIELSTCPTWTEGETVAPRRVDLRPFVLTGKNVWVLPGGLTRVALVEGSYVVNSSQGGGSKDTWVLGGRR